ncbi:MAG: 2-nitropropane dioxygenase [Hyphomonas sp. BRH_c22]|uniref:NAD(P)H-dependent flavin oxidoreductase n=1 Tax=Hyphomonas sp. BRH_c22 TaxID=1629710 RepID=UPI0005F132AC|nr:nitronate monooxygenase [Hyphomonas sp. BRH_c22]KJS34688.1 MAG: 2-nitropropane dioxygenase [Hyphomonas sp. BRH_c22]
MTTKPVRTRITDMLGIEKPIIQAAMGWIARSHLSSAVSNAGGMGIIETSSGELDAIREEILKMHDLTDKPFGVNVAQAFVRDPNIIDFIIQQGIKFVTTSAGDPMKYTGMLKEAGLTVFHVVPSLQGALRAIEAGVDGLIVEGGEGGGFKNPKDVASMVLIPLVCEQVNVPVVAAGGITDGRTMAAAFALGAEGVLMGTRILSSEESPVHQNWKTAIIDAEATDTIFLNRSGPGPALRALRTERTSRIETEGSANIFGEFADTQAVYFGGDLEAGIALTGQVAGRIHAVKPVAQIFEETIAEYHETIARLAR